MLVEFEFKGDICTLRLQGRFATGRDTGYLHTKSDELKNSGCSRVLVDLGKVDYIDSTGIGFLIGIYSSVLKMPSGRFALANLNRRVQEVMELTRLAEVIPIYPNETAALAALQSGGMSTAAQAH
jgi:anti-anti-sigma factor